MIESLEQTQDRIAGEVIVVDGPETTRRFPGMLDTESPLDRSSETYEAQKWFRAHEKRRLKAYLKGHAYFAHGRVPHFPIGFRNVMWPVQPKLVKNEQRTEVGGTEGAE